MPALSQPIPSRDCRAGEGTEVLEFLRDANSSMRSLSLNKKRLIEVHSTFSGTRGGESQSRGRGRRAQNCCYICDKKVGGKLYLPTSPCRWRALGGTFEVGQGVGMKGRESEVPFWIS